MHYIYVKLLKVFVIITLHLLIIQAQYNDDTTPRKVRLEDLEIDIEEKEQKALFSPQSENRYPYEDPQVYPTAPAHLYKQNMPLPRPHGIHPFAYNNINDENSGEADTDVVLSVTPQPTQQHHERQQQQQYQRQQQRQHQQQQSFYNNPHVGQASAAAFVLVPTFHGNGFSDERNYATPHPTQATTLVYQHQQPHHQQQLLIAPAGVRYLTSNELSDVAPTAPNYVLIRKPAQEYGIPDASFRQSHSSQQQAAAVQSNQFAYAPKRYESNSLAASYATIPYPPSFISITTSKPFPTSDAYAVDVPTGRYLNHATFKPSQPDPVPDFFSNRQTKSLLESYIPSWVVAKLVQQQRNSFNRNTLATPYNHQHYKRALTDLKDTVLKKRSVKKSLPPVGRKEKNEKLTMTA